MSGPHAGLNPDPAGRLACADCPVGDSAVCAVLSPQEKLALSGIGRHQTLAAGERLFDAGDDAIACATLISGSLKLSRLDEDGTERLFGIIHPSGFLGRLFSTQTDTTATALTEAKLCIFPRGDFERVLADRILRQQRAGKRGGKARGKAKGGSKAADHGGLRKMGGAGRPGWGPAWRLCARASTPSRIWNIDVRKCPKKRVSLTLKSR